MSLWALPKSQVRRFIRMEQNAPALGPGVGDFGTWRAMLAADPLSHLPRRVMLSMGDSMLFVWSRGVARTRWRRRLIAAWPLGSICASWTTVNDPLPRPNELAMDIRDSADRLVVSLRGIEGDAPIEWVAATFGLTLLP